MARIVQVGVLLVMAAGMALATMWQLRRTESTRALEKLEAINQEMADQLEARDAAISRLSRSQRVAHVQIGEQAYDDAGDVRSTSFTLIELEKDGTELGRQEFTVPGDVIMIDAWTIKFDFEQVADGHPLAGRTLLLLRRVYSDRMRPIDGFPIDTPGAVPPAYAVGEAGRFQQKLWEQFWALASDAALAESLDVRVAQGEAVYTATRSGQLYELVLDAAGGLGMRTLSSPELLEAAEDLRD